MRIEKVRIEGFRLLRDVEVLLERTATVIVGRNNSGKTSLMDLFDRFAGEGGVHFRLEDFSAELRPRFLVAKRLLDSGGTPEEVLEQLPKIVMTLTFGYDSAASELGPLAPFVIDLDENCTSAIARVEYAPTLLSVQPLLDIELGDAGADNLRDFYRALREKLSQAYTVQLSAVDPTDPANVRHFDGSGALGTLLQCGFVRAQRTLDAPRKGDPNVIGKLLSTLFQTASSLTATAADQRLATELKASVVSVEKDIQRGFDEVLQGLLPALEVFGFPSLNDTELRPETSLNVEGLLSDHTRVFYSGSDGVHLPEGYNGLGTRNLIYMLLQLESYHKLYRSKVVTPGAHLIFIEEPEAHLHPQMQEVFIKQLGAAVAKLSARYPDEGAWRVQFVVSTHSSHLANAASFEAVRYFLSAPPTTDRLRHTKVKDFRKGMSRIAVKDRDFLHQYMTLTKCDLYFADKAILVEGVTERILMPRLCQLVDDELPPELQLGSQYLTTVEVGGAYAHLFYPLLDFLELKTLVITDLDAVKAVDLNGKKRWVKCPVSEGTRSSNTALTTWFEVADDSEESITFESLALKTDLDKVKGFRRIAYQIPEEGTTVCARSYEDALVLANPEKFGLPPSAEMVTEAWEIAQRLPKAETALRFAIEEADWVAPRYIREGLIWLSEPPPPNDPVPTIETAELVSETPPAS